jgi:uncharacterized membrane protein YdjX (TVP38/TMEM64 family)
MKIFGKIRTIIFISFLCIIAGGLIAYAIWGESIPLDAIRNFIESSRSAPLVFVALYIALSIFFPTTPMMAIAGILFGFWYGLFLTTFAGFVSAVFTFYFARILGRSIVLDLLENKRSLEILEKYDDKITRHGIMTTIVLRITPIMPFNVLNLLLGVSRIKFRDYITGTLVGLAPSNVVAVYFGTFVLEIFK